MGNRQCCAEEPAPELETTAELSVRCVTSDEKPKTAAEIDEHPFVPVEFVVSVEKAADGKLGLSFDTMEECCVQIVTRIVPTGLIEAWNKANPDRVVQVDDVLVAVNGASEQLVQKIGGSQGQLELVFRRPMPLTFSLTKEDQLGASLSPGTEAIFLQSIKEGGVFAKSIADFGVKPGDRIVSVNGRRQDASTMIKSLQEAADLEFQVMSY